MHDNCLSFSSHVGNVGNQSNTFKMSLFPFIWLWSFIWLSFIRVIHFIPCLTWLKLVLQFFTKVVPLLPDWTMYPYGSQIVTVLKWYVWFSYWHLNLVYLIIVLFFAIIVGSLPLIDASCIWSTWTRSSWRSRHFSTWC